MLQNKIVLNIILYSIFMLCLVKVAEGVKITRKYTLEGWGKDPFISVLDLQKKIEEYEAKLRQQQEIVVDEGAEEEVEKTQIKQEISAMSLTGILKGEPNLAIINGEIYQEGEWIQDKELEEVGDGYIILAKKGYRFRLEFKEQQVVTTEEGEEQEFKGIWQKVYILEERGAEEEGSGEGTEGGTTESSGTE